MLTAFKVWGLVDLGLIALLAQFAYMRCRQYGE
jgi:intracellular septation protein A